MKLNIYNSVWEAYIHPSEIADIEFKDFVELCESESRLLDYKEQGKLFNMCSYRTDSECPPEERFHAQATPWPRTELIRRCKRNVELIYCLLLDVDGTQTLEQAVERWVNWEFFAYSTFGNSRSKEKFRMVVPLARPMTLAEFDSRHASMIEEFGVDAASFTISQAFYFPSYSRENAEQRFTFWNQVGQRYNALDLAAVELNTNILKEVPTGDVTATAQAIYRTLLTGKNLRYADALPLATICKSNGITSDQYCALVRQIAGADSSLRTDDVYLPGMYQKGYMTHVTHEKIIALMRRLGCDMWRWAITQQHH